eukprot:4287037-Amphidinium_carterae.1
MDEQLGNLARAKHVLDPVPHGLMANGTAFAVQPSATIPPEKCLAIEAAVDAIWPASDASTMRALNYLREAFQEFKHLTLVEIVVQLSIICSTLRTACPERLLGFLEGFAGEANLTAAMLAQDIPSKPMDITYKSQAPQDLCSVAGFRYWILLICFTLPDFFADQWHGIVCSSWVFMSRHTSGRSSSNLYGNEQSTKAVKLGDGAIKGSTNEG